MTNAEEGVLMCCSSHRCKEIFSTIFAFLCIAGLLVFIMGPTLYVAIACRTSDSDVSVKCSCKSSEGNFTDPEVLARDLAAALANDSISVNYIEKIFESVLHNRAVNEVFGVEQSKNLTTA